MVFFWFLVCSVPTGMLMNKIGRRKTVILSLVLTSVALIIPLIDYNLPLILISFSLLGISNAVMQVSLNPCCPTSSATNACLRPSPSASS